MDWNNAWVGGNQLPAPSGLMAPWSTSWGMSPTQQIVQKEVGPSLRSDSVTDGGGGGGQSVPGNAATAAQTSQATKDRVRGSLTGSLTGNVVSAGLKAGLGLGLGMPSQMVGPAALGSLASPGAVGNVLGGALNAAIGTQPQGFLGKTVANFGVPALAGMAFGPVGGLVGGLMGGVVADAMADGLDMRSREDVRDDYEGQAGAVKGRMAYADRVGLEQAAARVRDALPSSMAAISAMDQAIAAKRALERSYGINPSYGMNPGGSGGGRTSGASGGWGGFDAGRSVSGFGLGGRAGEVASGALDGMGFGGIGFGGGSGGSGNGGRGSSGGGGYGGHAGGKDGSSTGFGR